MLSGASIVGPCLVLIYLTVLQYVEHRQWWTLRLWISTLADGKTVLTFWTATIGAIFLDIIRVARTLDVPNRAIPAICAAVFVVLIFRFLLPHIDSKTYRTLRWKAWTGPSRTGIAPAMTRFLGSVEDWESLASSSPNIRTHPVESVLRLTRPFTRGHIFDPTDMLKARLKADEETDTIWLPKSGTKAGVYAPTQSGQSMSLLWGQDLGFLPRCSRGIIAVSRELLSFRPQLENGVDGRPLCLAHGILARNKGLEPHRLVWNLKDPTKLRQFEENSALWPRSSKTMRSCYLSEMSKVFCGLGDNYVRAATELALLLADSESATVIDWLDAHLEQQDLALNNKIAMLGASDLDLLRLYRGQYVAMLVSLSEHKVGIRIRPEIIVYKATCASDGAREQPTWLRDPFILERELKEKEILGARGHLLLEAAI